MKIKVIIVALILLGGFSVIALSGGQEGDSNSTNSNSNERPSISTGVDRYVVYDESVLASTAGTKRVLFFHATWCSTCNEFERQIKKSGVPEGLTIIKADYDSDFELRKRYKVNVQSTFVLLDENDEVVQRWPFGSGLKDISDLYEQVI